MSAVGRRARYAIRTRSIGTKVLTAVGYDGLPLMDLPPFGAVFFNEGAAKLAAEDLESLRAVEPQMSGE